MELEFSRQIFEKYPNIKFHENLSIGAEWRADGRTDMTNLVVAFRNFANATTIQSVDAVQWNNRSFFTQIHTKYINTLYRQNVGFLKAIPDGRYSNHWALKGHINQRL
jgi:hypothetical protein